MDPRFAQLPQSLQQQSKLMRLGSDVPSLVAHPDWERGHEQPVPAILWMHGRTVNKELDPGRYLRWIRAGIGAITIDLPGHGERYDVKFQSPSHTLELIAQGADEIDGIVESIKDLGIFDMTRLAIGGMSAGGMVTLTRLCKPHSFIGASVEGTTGNLHDLYFPPTDMQGRPWLVAHDPSEVAQIDPMEHLTDFRTIPILALHNEGDEMVPLWTQERFLTRLKEHYQSVGSDPRLIELKTFVDTGAPAEHAGFGRFANDAKNLQTEFFKELFGMNT